MDLKRLNPDKPCLILHEKGMRYMVTHGECVSYLPQTYQEAVFRWEFTDFDNVIYSSVLSASSTVSKWMYQLCNKFWFRLQKS